MDVVKKVQAYFHHANEDLRASRTMFGVCCIAMKCRARQSRPPPSRSLLDGVLRAALHVASQLAPAQNSCS
eukprot:3254135-Rhodomonas_salina.1